MKDQKTARWSRQILRLGVAMVLMLASVASAQSYRVLKSFAYGGLTNVSGYSPQGPLVQGPDGALYGTARNGGVASLPGTVFRLNGDGTRFCVLKWFTNYADGSYPSGSLVLSGSTLYGATREGGITGSGVIFKVNTDGSGFAVLKHFDGDDGAGPTGDLVMAGSTLYGTTWYQGGSNNCGVVFKMNTDGSGFAVLKRFALSDGAWPYGGLVLGGSTLYGTASYGGSSYCGVVFKVNTDGSGYAVLKNFTGSDGSYPNARLVLAGNTLYGATGYGGSLYSQDNSGYGVLFKVNTDGSGYTVLSSFNGSDGYYPEGGLVLSGSTLYGTAGGGGSSDDGVVFQVNTDGSGYTVLKSFTGSDGAGPAGLLLAGSTFYGTTGSGGSADDGVVFQMNTDGSGYSVLATFTGTDGLSPHGGLVLAGSTLYGTTDWGGSSYTGNSSGDGVVFKVNTDGSGFGVLKSLTDNDGANPYAGLVLAGNSLYGTTEYGGTSDPTNYPNGAGVVFEVDTDGSGYTVLRYFTGRDGANPQADLVLADGTLYGTTSGGGDFACGAVFSLSLPPPPSIVKPPLTQTAEENSAVGFWLKASGSSPLFYLWYLNYTNLISCSTNCELELSNAQVSQAGAYTVVVTNLFGAVTSAPALLNVIAPVQRRPVPGVKVTGETASLVNVDYADSLSLVPNWTTLGSISLTSTSQYWFDLTLPLPPQRFYRAWQTGTPSVMPSLDLHLVPAITLTGSIGHSVRLDYINRFGPIDAWVTLDTVTLTNTSQLYFDRSSIGQPARLWRIVPVP
jgi:uncharacterized repeat protein (TIGR03803 family)